MDYLENKIEQFQAQVAGWDKEKAKLERQLETATDKLKLIKDSKDREMKEISKKLADVTSKLKMEKQKTADLEHKVQLEKDIYNAKLQSINHSLEFKSIEESGIHSSKSIQKSNNKYLQHMNIHKSLSGSKTSTSEGVPQQSINKAWMQ